VSERVARRLLVGVGAVALVGGLSGAALAADATAAGPAAGASPVIKGCYNATSGALRVLTSHSKSCGTERKISWSQAGPPGNGYAFTSTTGTIGKFDGEESDGPVVKKAGTYFVSVNAQLNLAAYTSAVAGNCALDLAHHLSPTTISYVYAIFSPWSYPQSPVAIDGAYPFSVSGMVQVSAKRIGYQLILGCLDSSLHFVAVKSATWLVSPVSAAPGTSVPGHSTLGPAGTRLKPALKPHR
jgi:hypothetical protein